MNRENLENYLETLPKPKPDLPASQKILKVALFSARRSSRIGFWLVLLPGLVIFLFFLQNVIHVDTGLIRFLEKQGPSLSTPVKAALLFIFLVGFPLIAVVINLLSLSHFQYDRPSKEFTITLKIRWWNILITLMGAALAVFYILHILADSLLGAG